MTTLLNQTYFLKMTHNDMIKYLLDLNVPTDMKSLGRAIGTLMHLINEEFEGLSVNNSKEYEYFHELKRDALVSLNIASGKLASDILEIEMKLGE